MGFLSSHCNSNHLRWGVWVRIKANEKGSVWKMRRRIFWRKRDSPCATSSKHFLVVGVAMDGPRQSFLKFKDVLCKRISDILRSEGASSLWQCVARTYQIQSLFQPVLKKKRKARVRWLKRFSALMLVWKIKDHVNAHQHGVGGI